LEDHRRGTGQVFIATGRGAEGFLPGSRVGRIRDAMLPYLAREDYGRGLTVGVDLVAQAYASEFGVTLGTSPPRRLSSRPPAWLPAVLALLWLSFLALMLLARGRGLFLLWTFGSRGSSWSWGGGGGGGGFSGGLGGLGGEGGESADAFAIEYEEIRHAHRVLAGRDPWVGISVRREELRRQLESELMGKLVRLRQAYAAFRGDPRRLTQVIAASTAGVLTMLRTALRLAGRTVPAAPEDLVRQAGAVIGFGPESLDDVVAHVRGRRRLALAARDPRAAAYLAAVARTAEFVNRLSL